MDTSEFTQEQLAKAAKTILNAYDGRIGKYDGDKVHQAIDKAIDEMLDASRKFHKGQTVYTFEDPGYPCNPMIQECRVELSRIKEDFTVEYFLQCYSGEKVGWVNQARVFATKDELQAFYLGRLGFEDIRREFVKMKEYKRP